MSATSTNTTTEEDDMSATATPDLSWLADELTSTFRFPPDRLAILDPSGYERAMRDERIRCGADRLAHAVLLTLAEADERVAAELGYPGDPGEEAWGDVLPDHLAGLFMALPQWLRELHPIASERSAWSARPESVRWLAARYRGEICRILAVPPRRGRRR